jgi:septal ring factor EnvC (AmiA/AmiB activator)
MFKTNNISTPLHFATFYSSSYEIIHTLIRKYPLAVAFKERDLQLQKLQRTLLELEAELKKSQVSNALLQSRLQSLEKQIEEREILQEKLVYM